MSLAWGVKQRALEIGFDLAGIAPVAAWKDLDFSRRWVHQGYGGEMHYLENPKRSDPRLLMADAQSVICVGLVYNAAFPYSTEVANQSLTPAPSRQGSRWPGKAGTGEGSRAWISRYAWGSDYHEVMRAKMKKLRGAIEQLAPGAETRVYVDTGPVVERAFARLSGIGWMGKNTCLINQDKGSWFFLGVILTNLALEPDLPAADRCGSCARCIEACPTGALVEPYVMDASRCIAYFTIELKGSIPTEFRPAIGNNVFGCDICQDVCPWNGRSQEPGARSQNVDDSHQLSAVSTQPREKGIGRIGAATSTLPEFQPMEVSLQAPSIATPSPLSPLPQGEAGRPGEWSAASSPRRCSLFNPSLDDLAALCEADFRRLFRRSPIKRAKYRGWLRNLCVAMGNSGDKRFVPRLQELSVHPDPIVREHAAWALARLAES